MVCLGQQLNYSLQYTVKVVLHRIAQSGERGNGNLGAGFDFQFHQCKIATL